MFTPGSLFNIFAQFIFVARRNDSSDADIVFVRMSQRATPISKLRFASYRQVTERSNAMSFHLIM
jgi:hypothetical protein